MLFTQQIYVPLPPFTLDDDPNLPPSTNTPPNLGERGYSIARNQQVIFLENFSPAPLTYPLLIGETLIFFEGTAPFTPDMQGYIALAVDPQCRYCTQAGYPLIQTKPPDTLISLGFHIIEGGKSQGLWQSHRYPVPYFAGDGIVVAVSGRSLRDTNGNYKTLHGSFQICYATENEILPRGNKLFSIENNDKHIVDTRSYSIRNIMPPALRGGSSVRVTFHHHSSAPTPAIVKAAAGIRFGKTSSTKNFPLELYTVEGNSTFTILPGETIRSEWCPLVVQTADQLTVNCFVSNSWSMRTLSHASSYYCIGTDAHLNPDMPANTTYMPGRSYLVTEVEVS